MLKTLIDGTEIKQVNINWKYQLTSWLLILGSIEDCQAQPKVKTKASAFGWDGHNIIIIQPPTHPPGQVWRRRDRAKLRKWKLFVSMSRP